MSAQLPPGVIAFGPDATCDLSSCPLEWSVYQYRPRLDANFSLLAIFVIIGAIHTILGSRWRCWGFMVGMLLGSVAEVVGYTGRIMLYYNPFSFRAFMIQIVCLTIAPVFYTASIYITLSRAIVHSAPEISRFKPEYFYWVFIPADIVCLILQAAGGALSTKSTGSNQTGIDISMAGLILQVIILVAFIVAFADYILRYWKAGMAFDWKLKTFFTGLSLSIILILARCAYRVAELKDGYNGEIITHEIPFITLEGVFIAIAASALCFGHPGLVFI